MTDKYNEAVKLLREQKPIKEISTSTGYSTNRLYEIAKFENIKYSSGRRGRPKNSTNTATKQAVAVQAHTQKTDDKVEEVVEKPKLKKVKDDYVPRKIDGKKDTEILGYFYSTKQPVILVGESGTGKTHCVRSFCLSNGLKYRRLNLNGATTPEQLLGHFTPDGKGGFCWTDGVLTDAVRNGGVVVLDEINGANAEMTFAIHSLTDDEKTICLVDKDGEVVHAHKDFYLVATMNPDYEGTKPLNEALWSRFIPIEFDYCPEVEKKLTDDKTLEFFEKIRVMHREGELSKTAGTREIKKFEDTKKALGEKIAIRILLNHFPQSERKPIKEAYELICHKAKEVSKDASNSNQ